MGPSRTDYTRKIDYTAIKDGQIALDNAVLRLVKGVRGPRFNPIALQDILDWFRGAPQEMVFKSLHQHEDDNLIVKVSGGYRIKTFGDMNNKYSGIAELGPISDEIGKLAAKKRGSNFCNCSRHPHERAKSAMCRYYKSKAII